MVRILQLVALGLSLSGISTAVALPEADATLNSRAPPKCKKLTKREEWYVSLHPFQLPQTTTASS